MFDYIFDGPPARFLLAIVVVGGVLVLALSIYAFEAKREKEAEYRSTCSAKGMKYMSFAKGKHYDAATKTTKTYYVPVCVNDKGIMHTIETDR